MLFAVILFASCMCSAATEGFDMKTYRQLSVLPYDADSDTDHKWSLYFIRQASNRTRGKMKISDRMETGGQTAFLYLHVDPSLECDYAMSVNRPGEMLLQASSESIMLWLVYQWISKVAETDDRWNASDLDPAIVDWADGRIDFDFKYRSIYSSAMSDPDRIAMNADQHVDYSWGLWGHNIRKVFGSTPIPQDALAVVNGKRNTQQFCFSSESLYMALSEYIIDTYGYGEDGNVGWFAVLPNDNMHVCMCDRCRELGNTPQSATPAVTALLIRLATRFPHHHFYTSAYNTTIEPPLKRLPRNAGVIMSAIDLPLSTTGFDTKQCRQWREKFDRWKQVTDRVIIWDYMRNFDDYLTPYPCVESIRQRLKWFGQLGVYGVFYNGSGDDYASFDDVQTYLIASLLKNTEIDWSECAGRYFKRYYPQSWKVLYDYYMELETAVVQNRIQLEWYAGVDAAIKTYLDIDRFREFYKELDRVSKTSGEEERSRLNKLLTALDFTQLEIIRSGFNREYSRASLSGHEAKEFIELLEGHAGFKNMTKYKEANGNLSEYLHEWNTLEVYRQQTDNVAFGKDIAADKRLTDGYYGFPHDYHLHWCLYGTSEVRLPIHVALPLRKHVVQLSFLNAPVWKIGMPSLVEIYQGNRLMGKWTPDDVKYSDFQVIKAKINIVNETVSDMPLTIRVVAGEQPKTACDEIEIYPANK